MDKVKTDNIPYFQKQPLVDIEFQNLSYEISQGRKGSKQILRGINGGFRSGQLSAIMGSSGSGKTTLLNILAGYKTVGATGSIKLNGHPVDFRQTKEWSRYIMHEHQLQMFLTVLESMIFAADLKLGSELNQKEKLAMVSNILNILGLTGVRNTFSDQLSGGEKRRLSIALELINNQSVLFLDEPTTGLDDVSSFQCVSLLKTLAQGGRTIVCSIHTPSARNFKQFDNIYVLADGLCVFRGLGDNVLPFLLELGQFCPKHYNPADFIIEVSTNQYAENHSLMMSQSIGNGRNGTFCNDSKLEELINTSFLQPSSASSNFNCKFYNQFTTLLNRRCLQIFRNKRNLFFRISSYFVISLCMGIVFFGVGQDASYVMSNNCFCFTTVISLVYLQVIPVLLHFPLEIKIVKREHFNRWYGLGPYYLALTAGTLPIYVVLTFLSVGMSYAMSYQPMELQVFLIFNFICSMVVVISDSLGLCVASVFNVPNGMFLGPVVLAPLILIIYYGIGNLQKIPILVELSYHLSYLRYALEGIMNALYNSNRPFLDCSDEEVFCMLRDPKLICRYLGFRNSVLWSDIVGLLVWFLIFRLTALYLLSLRLQPNRTQTIRRYIKSF